LSTVSPYKVKKIVLFTGAGEIRRKDIHWSLVVSREFSLITVQEQPLSVQSGWLTREFIVF
jgi:hypothetical protein